MLAVKNSTKRRAAVCAGGRDLRRDQGAGCRDEQLIFHEDSVADLLTKSNHIKDVMGWEWAFRSSRAQNEGFFRKENDLSVQLR